MIKVAAHTQVSTPALVSQPLTCHLGQKSSVKCGPYSNSPLQTLDELDAASMRVPGKQMKISWMILSRVGVEYLTAPCGRWTVCQNHRKEFLDAWQVGKTCCHPHHVDDKASNEPKHLVSMVMSVKMLQKDGAVVPISGKLCQTCKDTYDVKYASKPGEKIVIIMPRAQLPMTSPLTIPSPFCQPGETSAISPTHEPVEIVPTTSKPNANPDPEMMRSLNLLPVAQQSNAGPQKSPARSNGRLCELDPSLSLPSHITGDEPPVKRKRGRPKKVKEPEQKPDDALGSITIKVEATENEEENGNDSDVVNNEKEEDLESIFSHDSDDDPTWAPSKDDKDKIEEKKEAERKRKRGRPPKKPESPKKRGRPKKSDKSESDTDDDDEEDVQSIDLSEKANRIEGAGGADFHYFCKICQISFYRHTAFKHHMMNSKDQHKKIKSQLKLRRELEMEYQCTDCCIAFKDKKSHQRHMAEEHENKTEHQYHCSKCNVHLKSESAFKSHNSKLHLERREKTYYCRECDETFSCLVKHSLHIVVHRTWSGEDMGMQCRICGKVFSRNQTLPFHRHLATHDAEADTECTCAKCVDLDDPDPLMVVSTTSGKKRKATDVKKEEALAKRRQRRYQYKANLILQQMKKNYQDEDEPDKAADDEPQDEDDEDDDAALKPFECGFCSCKFSTVEKLELHVLKSHEKNAEDEVDADGKKPIDASVIDEVADEFAGEVAAFEAAEENTRKQMEEKKAGKIGKTMVTLVRATGKVIQGSRPTERNWQECPDRNWAAEFGYGATKSEIILPVKLPPADESKQKTTRSSKKSAAAVTGDDLLSKMRSIFRTGSDDAEEDNEGLEDEHGNPKGDQVYRSRGLKGTVKASPEKAPRTLSTSSLRTRQRMEALMRRAREFMRNRKREEDKKKAEAVGEEVPKKDASKKGRGRPRGPRDLSQVAIPPSTRTTRSAMAAIKGPDDKDISKVDEMIAEFLDEEMEDDDDETDGLLIPLENGWVCEKRLVSENGVEHYSTSFWSPDGQRHNSLEEIRAYGVKHKLRLNVSIFENAIKDNPPVGDCIGDDLSDIDA